MAKKRFNIAVIPGDGIGKEVMPEGLRVFYMSSRTEEILRGRVRRLNSKRT